MSCKFVLTAITNDPMLAERVSAAGVDRVGIDIERLNKQARQGQLPAARISDHSISDLHRLAPAVGHAALFARLNPLHSGSRDEVEEALAGKAAVLMLPMFTTAVEVDTFVRLVDGRAMVVLLLETAAAVVRLEDILAVDGVDEVIVGLNDLHLATGVASHFELVVSDLMTMISEAVRGRGLRFGFGGVARAGDDTLPVPSDLVLAQHARLSSGSAWLARSFFGTSVVPTDVGLEVARLRDRLSWWATRPRHELDAQREALRRHLRSLIHA